VTLRHLIINRCSGDGIVMTGGGNHVIEDNLIGTDRSGTNVLPNFNGISIFGSTNNIIRGNTISGNRNHGIALLSGDLIPAAGNRIEGNFIGTDDSGRIAVPNGQQGIDLSGFPGPLGANDNIIGGTSPAARNVISGNGTIGIQILGGSGNKILGNFIGTDATGTLALPHRGAGIAIANNSTNNFIGGVEAGAGNLISGNKGAGVGIDGHQTVVQGNRIGTDASGTVGLGNSTGILIDDGSRNLVGGLASGAGNIIAFNANEGVLVAARAGVPDSAILNSMQANSIFANGKLGIDLGFNFGSDGISPNDPLGGDGDVGPNNLQNYPVLTSANTSGANLLIQGKFSSDTNITFRIEFFANAVCDASGHGEGEYFLGATGVTTDGAGKADFTAVLLAALPPGRHQITATATDPLGNTSEFSHCLAATAVSISIAGTVVTLSFPSQAGTTYNVEFKNALNDPAWTSLATVAGDGTVKTVSDPTAIVLTRIYRLRI
jgi:titin